MRTMWRILCLLTFLISASEHSSAPAHPAFPPAAPYQDPPTPPTPPACAAHVRGAFVEAPPLLFPDDLRERPPVTHLLASHRVEDPVNQDPENDSEA